MNIRPMTAADYEDVYALWLSCPGVELNSIDDSKDGIERFLKRNPDTCFVAAIDDRIVGVILCGNDGRRGYIYHAAVDPECRRHGIGSALVESVMKGLEELGINKAALVAFHDNEEGNAFWEKVGFIGHEDLRYRNRAIVEADLIRV